MRTNFPQRSTNLELKNLSFLFFFNYIENQLQFSTGVQESRKKLVHLLQNNHIMATKSVSLLYKTKIFKYHQNFFFFLYCDSKLLQQVISDILLTKMKQLFPSQRNLGQENWEVLVLIHALQMTNLEKNLHW